MAGCGQRNHRGFGITPSVRTVCAPSTAHSPPTTLLGRPAPGCAAEGLEQPTDRPGRGAILNTGFAILDSSHHWGCRPAGEAFSNSSHRITIYYEACVGRHGVQRASSCRIPGSQVICCALRPARSIQCPKLDGWTNGSCPWAEDNGSRANRGLDEKHESFPLGPWHALGDRTDSLSWVATQFLPGLPAPGCTMAHTHTTHHTHQSLSRPSSRRWRPHPHPSMDTHTHPYPHPHTTHHTRTHQGWLLGCPSSSHLCLGQRLWSGLLAVDNERCAYLCHRNRTGRAGLSPELAASAGGVCVCVFCRPGLICNSASRGALPLLPLQSRRSRKRALAHRRPLRIARARHTPNPVPHCRMRGDWQLVSRCVGRRGQSRPPPQV